MDIAFRLYFWFDRKRSEHPRSNATGNAITDEFDFNGIGPGRFVCNDRIHSLFLSSLPVPSIKTRHLYLRMGNFRAISFTLRTGNRRSLLVTEIEL